MTDTEFNQLFHEIMVWSKARNCTKSPKKLFIETLKKKYEITQQVKRTEDPGSRG